ncbi:MAG: dihydrofolate reductase family protein, partial [Nannocystaceae bacterium]
MSRVRVFLAYSLDGFIAGPNDDLSWLPGASDPAAGEPHTTTAVTYEQFIGEIGALLMGRRTYDVVAGFEGPWPYGELPVLVASHRPLDPPPPQAVARAEGEIEELIAQARTLAKAGDVYLDGGFLVRKALDAGLVDELILTQVPVVLGAGHALFSGVTQRHHFELQGCHRYGEQMVQLILHP